MIEGIVVVGDLLRPNGHGEPGGVDRPVTWLFNATKRQLHRAAGLPVEVATLATLPALRAALLSAGTRETAHLLWAAAHAGPPENLPGALSTMAIETWRRRFCVCYEAPPWLTFLLTGLDIPHIDIRIHPVRFLDDLLFAVRASHGPTRAALLDMAVPLDAVLITAGLREAMGRLISDATAPPDTLIVLGQRPLDASQIVSGRFFDSWARSREILDICASHRAVVLKPHPLETEDRLLEVAATAPNVLGVLNDNLYRLLAIPEFSAILTVSSSALHEAPFFGKRVHALAPPALVPGWRGMADGPNVYASLDDVVLSVDFWRTVLAPHVPVTPVDGVRLAAKPNRLRIALDSFWNFQEIDTDRIPGRGSRVPVS